VAVVSEETRIAVGGEVCATAAVFAVWAFDHEAVGE
jgi:hypothetical protein